MIIFDTYCGLNNQIYDILSGIHLATLLGIKFTFRYCCFRNDDLMTWFDVPFTELFDDNIFKYNQYYIPYNNQDFDINMNNSYNYESRVFNSYHGFNKDINFFKNFFENELKNNKYIIIKQIWPTFNNIKNEIINIHDVKPSLNIQTIICTIKKYLPEKYNCIAYRYEKDFTNYFNIKYVPKLDDLLKKLFSDNNYPIYICTNVDDLTEEFADPLLFTNSRIIIKDKYINKKLNYEINAFIDFEIAKSSYKFYGHSKSSFTDNISKIIKKCYYYDK